MLDIKSIESTLKNIHNGSKASDLESEKLEFKSFPIRDGIPVKKKISDMLQEYCVSFANSKGGALVIGVEDNVQGPDAFTGCRDYNVDEYVKMIFNTTHPSITVDITELKYEDVDLLVVFIPRSPVIHSTSGGIIYKRIGKENRIVYPTDIANLYVSKGYDYTKGTIYGVQNNSIDNVEIARMRNWLKKYDPGSEISNLSDEKMLESMGLIIKQKDILVPTIACLLLVGKEDIIREHIPQCETIFLHFQEDDTTPVKSLYLKTPLLKTIDKIWDMIEPYNRTVSIKDAFFETPVPSFPEDVVREGLLNALSHRDYSLNDAVYIKLYNDRIEISSPGGFIGNVTPENILTHPPVRRNPLLSEAFQYLGVVNKAGLGVDRMYKRLISYGKTPPEYPHYEDTVVLILRNGSFDETLAKFVGRKSKDGYGWKLDELIIIQYLRRNDRICVNEAVKLCQKSKNEVSEILSSMEGRFLERFGTGRGTYYQYNNEIYHVLGDKTKYSRISALSEERKRQMILKHLDLYERVSNSEVREICGMDRNQSYRLMKKLVNEGRVKISGKGRGVYYEINK